MVVVEVTDCFFDTRREYIVNISLETKGTVRRVYVWLGSGEAGRRGS